MTEDIEKFENPNSNEGIHVTGMIYRLRVYRDASTRPMPFGTFDTREEAEDARERFLELLDEYDEDDTEIIEQESVWRELDEPMTCDACGFENHYQPVAGWVFAEEGKFCSQSCYKDEVDDPVVQEGET